MATELLDGNTLRRVEGMLKHGRTCILRDRQCSGLAIRVHKTKATWSMITRDGRWTIGPLDMWSANDLPALRALVTRARQIHQEGRDPDDLFKAFRQEQDVKLAADRADVAHGIGSTWEEVRDAYLVWAADNKEKDTVRGYRSALGAVPGGVLAKDFEPIAGKPVASIITRDLVKVRSNIVRRGGGKKLRQADLTVAALKACFRWYLNQEDSLIEASPAAALSKVLERPEIDKTKARAAAATERTFNQHEIGLLIFGLESVMNPGARLSTMLQLLTGQRRLTPLEAPKTAFEEHKFYGMVWRLDDKVGSWRVLPLTEMAQLTVRTAFALTRSDNPYLFPQQRARRIGEAADGHLNERTVSAVIEELRKPGKILSTLPFSPSTHDLRKCFTTVMAPKMAKFTVGDRRLTPDDVEMITHSNEGRSTTASAVYDQNEYLDVKLRILEEWEHWCMEGFDRVRNRYAGKAA